MSSREITSVMTTVSYEGKNYERLERIFAPAPVVRYAADDAEGIAAALLTSDVAILKSDLDERYVEAPGLAWIHCDHAGLNGSAKPSVIAREDLIVTSSAGRAAPALAQHVLFFALALTYDAPGLAEIKAKHQWRGLPATKTVADCTARRWASLVSDTPARSSLDWPRPSG